MSTAARYLKLAVRLFGGAALLLGAALWAGYGRSLLPLHVLLGLALVLAMWALSVIAWLAAARRGFAAGVFVWGVVVLVLGMTQARLLPGTLHWIVQVLHLIIGGIAIGAGAALANAVEHRPEGAASASPAWGRQ